MSKILGIHQTVDIDNLVINGNFDHFQRATDGQGQASAYVSADRMIVDGLYYRTPTGKNCRLRSDSTNILSGTLAHGRISTVDALTNRIALGQRIENIYTNSWSGQTVTLTFYVRRIAGASCGNNARIISTIVPGTTANAYGGGFLRDTPELPTSFVEHSADFNNLSTTSFVKFSRTFTVTPTMAANGFQIGILAHSAGITYAAAVGNPAADSNTFTNGDLFDISAISITLGNLAPQIVPRRPFDDELRRCQRYFCYANNGIAGQAEGTTVFAFTFRFPVAMRRNPDYSRTATAAIRHQGTDFSSGAGVLQNIGASGVLGSFFGGWGQLTGFVGLTNGATAYDRGSAIWLACNAEI